MVSEVEEPVNVQTPHLLKFGLFEHLTQFPAAFVYSSAAHDVHDNLSNQGLIDPVQVKQTRAPFSYPQVAQLEIPPVAAVLHDWQSFVVAFAY